MVKEQDKQKMMGKKLKTNITRNRKRSILATTVRIEKRKMIRTR